MKKAFMRGLILGLIVFAPLVLTGVRFGSIEPSPMARAIAESLERDDSWTTSMSCLTRDGVSVYQSILHGWVLTGAGSVDLSVRDSLHIRDAFHRRRAIIESRVERKVIDQMLTRPDERAPLPRDGQFDPPAKQHDALHPDA